jgi:hypothetical protein
VCERVYAGGPTWDLDEGRVLLGAAAAARRRPFTGEHRLALPFARGVAESSAPACARSARLRVEGRGWVEGGGGGAGDGGRGNGGLEAEGGAEAGEVGGL